MNREWNKNEVFDDVPFRGLKRVEVKLSGLKTREEAANLQYDLLVKDSVIRAHVFMDKAIILINYLDFEEAKDILKLFPAELKAEILSEKTVLYEDVLKNTYNL